MSSDANDQDDGPDIPDQSWTNAFTAGTALHDLYNRRVRNQQDIVILLDDYHVRRGTGKTICSLQLAAGMDRTPQGMTKQKVALEPEAIREAYTELPKGSALVMDEAEFGVSNRQAMSNVNQALREIMSMGRVQEKYVVLNAPSIGFMDKDIRALATVWMTVTAKGTALVHWIENQPYAGKQLTPKKQIFQWADIQKGTSLRNVYNYLTREKLKRMDGEEGDGFIPRKEHRDIVDKTEKNAKMETRNDLLYKFYNHEETDVSYRILGEIVGLSPQRVNVIMNERED